MCEDKQAAGGECAQWYGDHVFKIFASNLDYKGREVKMLQDTWSYVQMKLFCDGMTNYVNWYMIYNLENITTSNLSKNIKEPSFATPGRRNLWKFEIQGQGWIL